MGKDNTSSEINVYIRTEAETDKDIVTSEKPQKIDHDFLPATGVFPTTEIFGLCFLVFAVLLVLKERSERK